ncbi:excinuclease ABC subunit UvrA [Gimesia maris]|uniref:UvrABC system protein A n=1 Tax=Gimesia maris TaxID=122 RepID=A0ABX5YSU5_9PLAN|nr:excinuclease ABC subunit UvrA [Gimesia maris]EDL58885.1 exinuclease ABC subunit A [Gimesia maris DSM 8797]QEG18790.1 UvrABC system protein A [Gimesia maris]QGQ28288.1 excinuclease ABC subunit UvrA [Gimesia maris]
MSQKDIIITGAREHNLQNVSVRLPRNQLIVMTGVSGSGKSSLAFDTLYAEGQRRYVESLSSYARQFLGQMPKPEVDAISGLAPSISIQQKMSGRNPRSTVGTITEIYDYLRVLFARVGQGFCENCGKPISSQSSERIIDSIAVLPDKTRYSILAPLIQQQKGEYKDLFEDLLKQGFLRARVDGRIIQLSDQLQLDRQMRHTIEVVIDRLVAGKVSRARLAESVELALKLANGTLIIATEVSKKTESSDSEESLQDKLYSSRYACTDCGISYEPPTPQLFSFNSPLGMCGECNGLGMRYDFPLDALISKETVSIQKGAFELLGPLSKVGKWRRHIYNGVARSIENDLNLPEDSFLKTPWNELPAAAQQQFLYGTGDRNITFSWRHSGGIWKHGGTWDGYVEELLESYRKTSNPMRRKQLEKYMDFVECSSCQGTRLNSQARHVRITSLSDAYSSKQTHSSKTLPEVCAFSIEEAAGFFETLDLDETGLLIADEVLKEIRGRLGFLLRCGLNYLTLDRTAPTLSGGESQRIRLAGQIGCGLVGVVYILDEPSIGLHPRDNTMLLESLCDLRDQGNTVIVVEHDEETMRAADHIVDFGPGPGVRGGYIVAEGSYQKILKAKESVTGQFLAGKEKIEIPEQRRSLVKKDSIVIKGAKHHNLKDITTRIPTKGLICVTGVSGSGKSSLINDILWPVLNQKVNKGKGDPGSHQSVTGLELIDKAIDIDQSPIGRTPRSNPATYVKVFDLIRDLYTKLPDSRMRGYKAGRFSFNVPGGRCEACEGHGANKLEMDFLADVWVPCPVCEGRRFHHETLEIRYKGANIAEVLEMDIQQAIEHFQNVPKILKLLESLHDVGLDYLKLGQPSPTLSGGEAQRVKLARELGKRSTGSTFYLLDEPTTGLHFADVKLLLKVLHHLADAGNTVLVVEHHLDVIKTADWVIDLGPEGGEGGGTILVEGTPEEVAACPWSYTGLALKEQTDLVPAKTVKGKKKQALILNNPHLRWQSASTKRNGKSNGDSSQITIRGAGQHNLQNVDLQITRDQMNVFCGPSGSGKSSLAMDTLYAEGQRRYVESLSAYARQFLGQMPKPKFEHIHGLSPAIAIEQKTTGHSPRSTVGTVTEIYDYLRVLYARLGTMYCPDCDVPVETQTTDEVIERILAMEAGTRLLILAPVDINVGQAYETLWEKLRSQGFLRVRIDGVTCRLEEVPDIDRRRRHEVEVVIDRITVAAKNRSRIADSVESALALGAGLMYACYCDDEVPEQEWDFETFSLFYFCDQCGQSFEELTPHNYSFNSPLGWCEYCEGLGTELGTNLSELIPDPNRSLQDAAVAAWPDPRTNAKFKITLDAIAKQFRIPLDVPFNQLSVKQQRFVLYGDEDRWIPLDEAGTVQFQYKGLYPAIEEASRLSFGFRSRLQEMTGEVPCSVCNGSRLRTDAAAVRFQGKTVGQFCDLPLKAALAFIKTAKLDKRQKQIAGDLIKEATSRLQFLVDVGLEYLTLSRPLPTLSGGESQRIRLAGQVGRSLTGVLYVLDEPTIGLHPRDNTRLINTLKKLRDIGNTIVMVEHDREVLEASDCLYDFGPGAGRFGGTIVGKGSPKQLKRKKKSLTGQYLADQLTIPLPQERRVIYEKQGKTETPLSPTGHWLELKGARQHNLKSVDLKIPLGSFTCITGVSGSGKSSLVEETLARAVTKKLHRSKEAPGPHDDLLGLDQINKAIIVDQKPLGNTPASNPATYTGVFDQIRELFSRLPDAKVRGYQPGRFSFNRSGGRCEDCDGNGQRCIEMHFLPDVWVTCETCNGKRYNQETLSVKYKGKSIADVLEMSIGEVAELFNNIPAIRRTMETLCAIGLDYLTLGQSAPTLSGGESQRVKLAAELARPSTGKTLYLLDEPTTGLHFDDIAKLLKVLNSLVELGNTVIVIEHNLDVIKTADWLVDVGPEAGSEGGQIIAAGTPEKLVEHAERFQKQGKATKSRKTSQEPLLRSYTGEILQPIISTGKRVEREIFDAQSLGEKQEGDLDLKQIGRDAQMPWQKEGRRWHTQDHVSLSGAACQWEGAALETVIDFIENKEGFGEINWNHRSIVEVNGPVKKQGWFLHANTGDEWLLRLSFRVKRNTFKQDELRDQLSLKSLDDLDELPIYGRSNRVRVKNLKGPWQEVSLTIHWQEEIATPGFQEFLETSCESYLGLIHREEIKPEEIMPWKVLKKKWHLSRKGFPNNKRVRWDAELLESLFDLLEQTYPHAAYQWDSKSLVNLSHAGKKKPFLTVHTKRREGVDLTLQGTAGKITLGKIADLGDEREIKTDARGKEQARIRFTQKKQVESKSFKALLASIT